MTGISARRTAGTLLLFVPAALVVGSLVVACGILIRFSFNSWDPVRTMTWEWQLGNYARLFNDVIFRRAFLNTVRISVVVTAVCLLIGYPVAYGMSRSRRRELLVFLLVSPLLMDVLLRAYGWLVLLSKDGLVNSAMVRLGIWSQPQRLIYTELSVVLELVHELIPFMVLPIAAVMERIDPALGEAAMNLKAGPVRSFWHVMLPLTVPGIVAGTLLTFSLSMSAFVAPLILGGGNVTTMTLLIQQQMLTTLDWPRGATQAIVLVAVVLVLLMVYGRQVRRGAGATARA
jgi:putative spermidine/putrescine transport system permease protein